MDDPSTEPNIPQPGFEQQTTEQPSVPPQAFPPSASQAGWSAPPRPPSGTAPAEAPVMFPYSGLAAPPAAPAREPWLERGDVRAATIVAGVLVVLGVVAGLLWAAISPHGTGVVVTKTEIVPIEQENWIAADGRFALITAVIGLVVGLLTWFWRSRRGPVLAAGLAVGSVIGSLLTAVIGTVVSSGHSTGKIGSGIRLHVVLHAHGLIAIEGVLALAAYLGGVLFAGPDDLGRPSGASATNAPPTNAPPTGAPPTNAPPTTPADPGAGWSAPVPGYGS